MPTSSSIRLRAPHRLLAPTFSCRRTASAIWSPTRKTGFSEVIGSWKIIEISLPRTFPSSRSESFVSSRPSKTIRLPGSMRPRSSSRPMIESAVTDLPLPDSPTTPSVPPAWSSKSTPSTARITPASVENDVRRFSTREQLGSSVRSSQARVSSR